jgi:hypothetical protein
MNMLPQFHLVDGDSMLLRKFVISTTLHDVICQEASFHRSKFISTNVYAKVSTLLNDLYACYCWDSLISPEILQALRSFR